jgi:hypothetical protein
MRVAPEHEGRLVVVERRGAPAALPTGACVPTWRILVMGREITVEGRGCGDLWAAEPCIRPLCQLTVPWAKKLVMAQFRRDADMAVADLLKWLADHPLDHALIDAGMMGAAREAIARHHARPVLLPYNPA